MDAGSPIVREAVLSDLDSMVRLARKTRHQLAEYQPVFWRIAEGSDEAQRPFFASLIEDSRKIVLIWEEGDQMLAFAIAALVPAPPVYDPGGLTCILDDFAVLESSDWQRIGSVLLASMSREAGKRGAAQMVVICPHLDEAKRKMLFTAGYEVASEWFVRTLPK